VRCKNSKNQENFIFLSGVSAGDRLIAGGNWNNGANCGSRYSNWNNSTLNLNSNNGCRAVADTRRLVNEYQRLVVWAGIQPRADFV